MKFLIFLPSFLFQAVRVKMRILISCCIVSARELRADAIEARLRQVEVKVATRADNDSDTESEIDEEDLDRYAHEALNGMSEQDRAVAKGGSWQGEFYFHSVIRYHNRR